MYVTIVCISLFINVVFILIPFKNTHTFDKRTAISLRLAESKYLNESDKISILAADINNINFDEVEFWKLKALEDKLRNKVNDSKIARI